MKLNDVTQTLTELNTDDSIITDYPIRMCGNEFLKNLKYVCSIRGIYTPINRFKRSFKQYYNLERILQRQKRFDDLCTLYTIYEPDQVVTQCCCIGCNRNYLEQFCNPN
uniref:IlGF domain-containing protein n=1 Tax=Schistosoma mansoni TaxID=6183 RepID=A0A5K4F6S6_SCHMA